MIFQFIIKGRAGPDKDLHLVKWVRAPSEEACLRYVKAAGLETELPPINVDAHLPSLLAKEKQYHITLTNIPVDVELDEGGRIVKGSIGEVKPR